MAASSEEEKRQPQPLMLGTKEAKEKSETKENTSAKAESFKISDYINNGSSDSSASTVEKE